MNLFGLADRKCKLLFQDGADYYGGDTGLKWTAANGSLVDLSGTNSRTGIGAIACQGVEAPSQSIPASTDLFIGIGTKIQSLSFPGQPIVLKNSGGSSITIQLSILENGGVTLIQGPFGPTLATSIGGLINAGEYAYIELGFSSSTQKASVRVNGLTVIPLTDFTIALPDADTFTMTGAGGGSFMWVDDIYVCDNTGAHNNTFLGAVRLYSTGPTGDSTPLQWTPSSGSDHFSLVNAIPPNGGTDFVSSATPGQIDQYVFPQPSGITPPVTVFGVCVALLSALDAAGSRAIASQIGANTGAAQALTTTYHIVSTEYDINPDTGDPWLLTDFPATVIGPTVVS
jgi:hypothetical protein